MDTKSIPVKDNSDQDIDMSALADSNLPQSSLPQQGTADDSALSTGEGQDTMASEPTESPFVEESTVPSAPPMESQEQHDVVTNEQPIVESPPVEQDAGAPQPEPTMQQPPAVQADQEVPADTAPPADLPEPAVMQPSTDASSRIVSPESGSTIAAATTIAHKSNKAKIVAVAVGLAVVLAALAVLAFVKMNSSTKTVNKTPSTQSQSQQADTTSESNTASQDTTKTPVKAADVDAVTKDVDTTLSTLDNTKDFGSDGLSDKTLGLQ